MSKNAGEIFPTPTALMVHEQMENTPVSDSGCLSRGPDRHLFAKNGTFILESGQFEPGLAV
jgi:hypothetical protein